MHRIQDYWFRGRTSWLVRPWRVWCRLYGAESTEIRTLPSTCIDSNPSCLLGAVLYSYPQGVFPSAICRQPACHERTEQATFAQLREQPPLLLSTPKGKGLALLRSQSPAIENRKSAIENRQWLAAPTPYPGPFPARAGAGFLFATAALDLVKSAIANRQSKIVNGLPPLLPTPARSRREPGRASYSLLPLLSCEIVNRQSSIENGIIAVLCHFRASSSTNGINKIEAQKPRFGFPTASFISSIFNGLTALRPDLRVRLRVRSDPRPLLSIS